MRTFPPIPPIPDDLYWPASRLTEAAEALVSFIALAAEDNPKVCALIREHARALELAEGIIKTWRTKLGHDLEDKDVLGSA